MNTKIFVISGVLSLANVFGGGLAPGFDARRNVHVGGGIERKSSDESSKNNDQRQSRTYRRSKKDNQKSRRKIYTSYHHHTVEHSSTQPACAEQDSLFSEAAALYLWAKQDNMYLGEAISGDARTLFNPHFHGSPGFRAAFGYRNYKCDWTLGLSWTYFRADPRTSATAATIDGLETTSTFTTATQDWKLTYNSAQLMLKGPASINGNLALNAAFGVEAAFLHQRKDLDYVGSFDNLRIRDKNNFSGAGPSVAFESRFALPYHFGLLADLGASLLWGNIKASRVASGASDLETINNHNRAVPALHTKVGFDWTALPKSAGIKLFLGWEMHHFWNQWQVQAGSNPLLNPKGGSVSMSGIIFSADVCF